MDVDLHYRNIKRVLENPGHANSNQFQKAAESLIALREAASKAYPTCICGAGFGMNLSCPVHRAKGVL